MNNIVVATTNKNKVERIKRLLKGLDYEVISLEDADVTSVIEPEEKENTPVKIAMEKALYYIDYLPENTIVLTQDDTIKLEGVQDSDDPKLSIKQPVREKYGKFTDELAAKYYSELAAKYGGSIPMTFNYGHAIAIKKSNDRNIIKVVGGASKVEARLVDKIYKLESAPGYFLSALIEVNVDGKWIPYNDLNEKELIDLDKDLYLSITNLLEQINY